MPTFIKSNVLNQLLINVMLMLKTVLMICAERVIIKPKENIVPRRTAMTIKQILNVRNQLRSWNATKTQKIAPGSCATKEITRLKAQIVLRNTARPTNQKPNVLKPQSINVSLTSQPAHGSCAMKKEMRKPNIVLRNTVKTTNMKSNVLSPQLTNATVMLLIAPGSYAKKEIT